MPMMPPAPSAGTPAQAQSLKTQVRQETPMKLDAYWMPFTANRQFKKAPRLLARSSGMHYWTHDGRQILDGVAGLWCVNAGHARPRIVQAIQEQAAEMDFAPPFQMAHPKAFELAEEAVKLAPAGMTKLFFTNSGSESVDTALKMALAYHRVRGEGHRTRLIGREKGYHGVNFGGLSVGGIVSNRKMFGAMLAGVDHIRHTHDLQRNAFSLGQPEHGAELADDLERLCVLHEWAAQPHGRPRRNHGTRLVRRVARHVQPGRTCARCCSPSSESFRSPPPAPPRTTPATATWSRPCQVATWACTRCRPPRSSPPRRPIASIMSTGRWSAAW
jgi:hypothetical protein